MKLSILVFEVADYIAATPKPRSWCAVLLTNLPEGLRWENGIEYGTTREEAIEHLIAQTAKRLARMKAPEVVEIEL